MRILLVSSNYFYPPFDGCTLRDYNIFKRLPEHIKLDLLTFGDLQLMDGELKLHEILGPCFRDVEIIPRSTLERIKLNSIYSRIANLIRPNRLTMGESCYSNVMTNAIKNRIECSKYDLIYFCGLTSYLYLENEKQHIPYIVDVQDSPAILMRSYLLMQRYNRELLKAYLNLVWARNYERIHFAKIKNMIFVSEVDATAVKRRCPHSNIWVVPAGVDTDYFKPLNRNVPVTGRLVFTGVMDYPPNHQAMVYFIKEVLPIVKQHCPQVSLTVAGRNPSDELRALAVKAGSVYVTGFVEDIRTYVDEALVYVSPLIAGAGIKNKILEAWAMSKPVVATSISCAGIDTVDGENILVADDPYMFAEKIKILLSDPKLRNKIALGGRHTAEKFYSWDKRAGMMVEIFGKVINDK